MEQNTDRINALIKLILWLVFIAILILIAKIGGKTDITEENFLNNEKEEVKIISYEEKLNKLSNNYKYNYEIKVGNEIYKFEGSKLDNRESGSRTHDEEQLEYFLENGYVYSVVNGGLDKIETIYENMDVNNIDISLIKNNIQNIEYQKLENRYDYILENKTISVYTNDENIIKIETIIGEDYYKLEFSDIGLVEEVKY